MPKKPTPTRSKSKPSKGQAPGKGPGALLEHRLNVQGQSIGALLTRVERLEAILAQKPDGLGARLAKVEEFLGNSQKLVDVAALASKEVARRLDALEALRDRVAALETWSREDVRALEGVAERVKDVESWAAKFASNEIAELQAKVKELGDLIALQGREP